VIFALLRHRKNSAVALVFFMLVLGLSLAFSMVVLNTGLIVYQKMRLQNSVDLAAYAGASVQASYLGNESSGEESIVAINNRIIRRYIKLLEDINHRPNQVPVPWFGFPERASCMAACAAGNLAVSARAVSIYRSALRDIEEEHDKARRILEQMPDAVRAVMEKTIALNIPDLEIEGGPFGGATSDMQEILGNREGNFSGQPRNVALSFTSDKGAYLANVVAGVPHRTIYYGPSCADMNRTTRSAPPFFYCTINGQGATGSQSGWALAVAAYGRGRMGGEFSGNIGQVQKISNPRSRAIKLHFIEDPHKPKPFVVAAAEWFPPTGNYLNLEKSFGAKGQLIPERTRLAAVSAAEPFGGYLTAQQVRPWGTRLQAIRKVLLDPRMRSVREDFGGLFDYMQYVGPKDEDGNDIESVEETIRRFLH